MYKEIANEDLVLGSDDSDLSLSSVTITSLPSTSVKAEGKKVYFGTLVFTVTGTYNGNNIVTGNGAIDADSKVKSKALCALKLDDEGSIIGTLQVGSSTVPFESSIKIINAGQTKVKAK